MVHSSETNYVSVLGYTGAICRVAWAQPERELRSKYIMVLWALRIVIPQSTFIGYKMNIIKDRKSLTTRIKSVAKRAGTIQDDMQEVLASCGFHYREHGDNSLLTQAVNAMPAGFRKDSMTGWVAFNFQCKWDSEKLRFKKSKVSTFLTDSFDSEKYLDVVNNAWYNFGIEERSVKPWMLIKMLEKAVRDVEKHDVEAKEQAVMAYDAALALTNKLHEIGCTEVDKVA